MAVLYQESYIVSPASAHPSPRIFVMFLYPRLLVLFALVALPAYAAPEKYVIDPDHTYPSFEMPHMGISVWRGKFTRSSGEVTLDLAARSGSVNIEIASGSIDFGHAGMDTHAVTDDWLNASKYPTMTYAGTLRFNGDTPSGVDGSLTLRGVTKPVKLTINTFKCIDHPYYNKPVCGADASGEFDRADFGMTQYADNGMGRIRLQIQVEAFKDKLPAPPEATKKD